MNYYFPYLEIQSPDGQIETIRLDKMIYTVGRYSINDIELTDEEKMITRVGHCIIERDGEGWFVKDQSTHGTFLQRKKQKVNLQDIKERKALLFHEDIIIIQEWKLKFLDLDPDKTRKKTESTILYCPYVFNLSQLMLYKVENGKRIEIELPPHATKMLAFLAKKKYENQNNPIVCTYEELIRTIWDEIISDNPDIQKEKQDVNIIAKKIRDTLATSKEEDREKWLETRKAIGYMLKIYCEP